MVVSQAAGSDDERRMPSMVTFTEAVLTSVMFASTETAPFANELFTGDVISITVVGCPPLPRSHAARFTSIEEIYFLI